MAIFNQVVAGSGGGGSVSEPYLEFEVDANGVMNCGDHVPDFTGVKTINVFFQYCWKNNTSLSGIINLHDLVSVLQNNVFFDAFYGCINVTGFDLTSLQTIGGMAVFKECFSRTGIQQANFPSLTRLSGNNCMESMFSGCTNLVSFNMPLLSQLYNNSFASIFLDCTGLVTGRFPSVNKVSYIGCLANAFKGCTSLQTLWFYALDTNSFGNRTDQFKNMLSGVTGSTVHFPIAIQSTIGSWSDVTAGFGGTNTTVLFDLVTSLTGADGNTYTRQEKDSTSTATAWVYNDTLYYTSGVSDNDNGVNEPAVSDAIYSDAACTQSVTTITAIA